jgi:hypothetical protein
MVITIKNDEKVLTGWWVVLALAITIVCSLVAFSVGCDIGDAIYTGVINADVCINVLLLGLLVVANHYHD